MTPALSQSGNARDGIVPGPVTTTGDARKTARPAWPARSEYATGNRLLPLEPSKDDRPHIVTDWMRALREMLR